jgi:type II secretory pathway pseudopilin PulG
MNQQAINKAIASSISIALLSTISTNSLWLGGSGKALAQTPTPTESPSQPLTPRLPVAEELIGEWQLKEILPVGIKVIFTRESKLFILLPLSFPFFTGFSSSPVAFEFRYRINPDTQPIQIDVSSPSGGEPLLSIFEMSGTNEMRVEWIGLTPGESRPTEFTTGSIVLEKLSNITALPRKTQIVDLYAQQLEGQQSNAQNRIRYINNSQRTYYGNNGKFTNKFEDLKLGVPPATEGYQYQLVSQTNLTRSAIATAKATNSGLRSYTGAIFAFKVKGKTTFVSGICETDTPSNTPPAALTPPKTASGQIQCPAGSRRL